MIILRNQHGMVILKQKQNLTDPRPTKASRQQNQQPSSLRDDLFTILSVGYILCFLGGIVLYVWYAAAESSTYLPRRGGAGPLPIFTDMLGDWHVLSLTFFGVGVTTFFGGLGLMAVLRIPADSESSSSNDCTSEPALRYLELRDRLVRGCVLMLSSVWYVLVSSPGFPYWQTYVMSWLHNVSTFTFMATAIYVMYISRRICSNFLDDAMILASQALAPTPMLREGRHQEMSRGLLNWVQGLERALVVVRWCVWASVLGIAAATLSAGAAVTQRGISPRGEVSPFLWQVLACSEILLLAASSLGYLLLMYAYSGIEELFSAFE